MLFIELAELNSLLATSMNFDHMNQNTRHQQCRLTLHGVHFHYS